MARFLGEDWIDRLERILVKVEELVDRISGVDGDDGRASLGEYRAFRWVRRDGRGRIVGVRYPDEVDLNDLLGIDDALEVLRRNTKQFVLGLPANNILLWGDRGTGKSSAVKGLLTEFGDEGLRIVEVHKDDTMDIPEIVDILRDREERYILFLDDLSFEENESSYKELKALLEGGISAKPPNVLVYATSNRRHLIPERFSENSPSFRESGDIHANETSEGKISLSDRFGIALGFYSIGRELYLRIVAHYAAKSGLVLTPEELERGPQVGYAQGRDVR